MILLMGLKGYGELHAWPASIRTKADLEQAD